MEINLYGPMTMIIPPIKVPKPLSLPINKEAKLNI
jgi:hypothetical protein